jgi:hypothetical protein
MYADTIGIGLAGQALFAYAPEAERARRVVSKLRQVPRLVQAARDNIKESPGIFVKTGLESWRGVLSFMDDDIGPRRSRRSTTSTSWAIWPTPPPRRQPPSRLTSRISKPTSPRAPRRRSGSVGSGSSRN